MFKLLVIILLSLFVTSCLKPIGFEANSKIFDVTIDNKLFKVQESIKEKNSWNSEYWELMTLKLPHPIWLKKNHIKAIESQSNCKVKVDSIIMLHNGLVMYADTECKK